MRKISKFEEYFVTQMTDIDWKGNLNLVNLLDKYLTGVRIKINIAKKSVDLLFEIQNPQPTENETKQILSRINEVNQIIISTVNLLNLLEKDSYIIVFDSANQIDNEITFGQGASNLPFINYSFPDERTSELLIKYATPQIIPTAELIEYRKSNFQTRGDKQFNKNVRLAWTAIIISIVATCISLFFSIYSTFIKKDGNDCICPLLT